MREHSSLMLALALCAPFATACLQTLDEKAASGSEGGPPDLSLDTPPIELPNGDTTTDSCVATGLQAHAILQNSCAGCHGGDGPGARQGQPPFDFVLDDARLTTVRSVNVKDVNDPTKGMLFVAPGNPDDSRIYRRIVAGEMPPMLPIGVKQPPRPTISDMSILQTWITTCVK
jgi:mono/diheme cytochrome c family protein